MNIRTIIQLQDYLDQDLSWRLKEISSLKIIVDSTSGNRQIAVIRACIPLLYAHWEGFIKKASEAYLSFVNGQRLCYTDLAHCFLALGAKARIANFAQSKKMKPNIEVVNFFLNDLGKRANLKFANAIDTESNLSSVVFENIALSIGIKITPYQTDYKFIDSSLLNRRNSIAHGEDLDIDQIAYQKLSDKVVVLLRNFKGDIQNGATLREFQRAPISTQPAAQANA